MEKERSQPRTVVGTVVSDKMQKTITVREDRLVKHGVYGKYIHRASQYKAHDENGEAHLGDQVEILATRPLSKTKHWRLLRVVRRAAERHDDAAVLEAEGAASGGDATAGEEASS